MIKNYFRIRCASIILVAAGYGWAGGHYIPTDSTVLAYLFQFVVIFAILIMGVAYLTKHEQATYKSNWTVKGLTIFSALMFVVNIANIIHGVYSKDKNSLGSHNSFADLVPITFILAGTGLWLLTAVKRNIAKR